MKRARPAGAAADAGGALALADAILASTTPHVHGEFLTALCAAVGRSRHAAQEAALVVERVLGAAGRAAGGRAEATRLRCVRTLAALCERLPPARSALNARWAELTALGSSSAPSRGGGSTGSAAAAAAASSVPLPPPPLDSCVLATRLQARLRLKHGDGDMPAAKTAAALPGGRAPSSQRRPLEPLSDDEVGLLFSATHDDAAVPRAPPAPQPSAPVSLPQLARLRELGVCDAASSDAPDASPLLVQMRALLADAELAVQLVCATRVDDDAPAGAAAVRAGDGVAAAAAAAADEWEDVGARWGPPGDDEDDDDDDAAAAGGDEDLLRGLPPVAPTAGAAAAPTGAVAALQRAVRALLADVRPRLAQALAVVLEPPPSTAPGHAAGAGAVTAASSAPVHAARAGAVTAASSASAASLPLCGDVARQLTRALRRVDAARAAACAAAGSVVDLLQHAALTGRAEDGDGSGGGGDDDGDDDDDDDNRDGVRVTGRRRSAAAARGGGAPALRADSAEGQAAEEALTALLTRQRDRDTARARRRRGGRGGSGGSAAGLLAAVVVAPPAWPRGAAPAAGAAAGAVAAGAGAAVPPRQRAQRAGALAQRAVAAPAAPQPGNAADRLRKALATYKRGRPGYGTGQ